jgi:excisionase family DNA binding protein
MNREEAANELGISVRSLQRAVAAGKLGVTYKRGESGKQEAAFDTEEIKTYKETMESETVVPAVAVPGSQALMLGATTSDSNLARSVAFIARESVTAMLEATNAKARPSVAVESKLMLKLDEAALLTGLSRGTIRAAIDAGKLKAKIIGRAWRVKRDDLEAYIKKL